MELINGRRGTGKTTAMIWVAGLTGYPLVVPNQKRKEYILNRRNDIKKLGGKDFDVLTISEWYYKSKGKHYEKILIDDLDSMLSQILKDYFGVEVQAATVSIPMKELEEDDLK